MFITFLSKRLESFYSKFNMDGPNFPPIWTLLRKIEATKCGRYVYIPELDTPIF